VWMYDPINPAWYHFWSSGLVGLLGLVLIYLTTSRSQSTAQDGCTGWISSRQFYLLLLLAVWLHIPADMAEHGYPPRILSGMEGLVEFVTRSLI
jgi:hypothetical protein